MGNWVLFLVSALALPLGFLAAMLRHPKSRSLAFLFVLSLPVLAYTILMALAEPAEPGFTAWWLTGLIMISVPLAVWAVLAPAAFSFGRANCGDRP